MIFWALNSAACFVAWYIGGFEGWLWASGLTAGFALDTYFKRITGPNP